MREFENIRVGVAERPEIRPIEPDTGNAGVGI
jgi:hypothetical protein